MSREPRRVWLFGKQGNTQMALVGLVGWRGMVGSVLMDRMQAEGDFAHFEH